MAGSYARVTLIGNLGRDPESRHTASGDTIASFSLATSLRSRENGELVEQTTWWNCSAFGKLAETCMQFLRKGSYVYLEGEVGQRAYTDRDGNSRQSLDVRVREMRMLERRLDQDQGNGYVPSSRAHTPPLDLVDEVPF